MPHVSKNELDEGIKAKLFDQLFETFKTAGRRNSTSHVITELFTSTEKIMFAKRLAIVLLLKKEVPQHVIVSHLQVSPSTIARVSLDVEIGKYDQITKMAGNKMDHLMEVLIKLIFFSMPPRVGRGRWKNLNKLFD